MAIRPGRLPSYAVGLLFGCLAAGSAVAETSYEIVAGESELRVLVFRAGALARLGHNHVISTRDISGTAVVGASPGDSRVDLTVPVRSLVVDDPAVLEEEGSAFAGERSEDDVAGTRRNMLGPDLLHAEAHDEVRIGSESISGEFPQVTINARVTVRGVEYKLALPVSVSFRDDGFVASGSTEIAHAELGLSPVEAAFGAVRVAEVMIFRYRIVARESATADEEALVDPARIDSVLQAYIEREELVGVSALVYENGAEAYFGAFGMADREAERPMRRDTLVRIYSMTKPVTGVVLMTLYEEGLFGLDDPLEKHLPEYAGIEVYAGEGEGEVRLEAPVRAPTVRDILRHTAGFASGDDGDQSPIGDRYRAAAPVSVGNTLEDLSQTLAGIPLLYQPGTRWYYGPSVDVQARLVEVLSGQPYEEVLRERLLDPLGMDDTRYTLRPDQHQRMSALYERHPDGSFTRVPDEEAFAFNSRDWPLKPGGWGLFSTLDDYMRFARMLLNGGELDGVRILEAETVKLMATDAMPPEVTDKSWLVNKGRVGFGIDFAVRVAPPGDQAEASGAVGEFFWDGLANTLFWVDPANGIAAVLFNQYRPFGKTEIQKDFRDAVYYRDPAASALNKAPPGSDSRRLSD